MKSKNIVLIGFMGCGKSTIGKLLAKKLNFCFIDTDILIQNQQNKSIQEIFDNFGEKYFRELEKTTYNNVSKQTKCVIATGGGVIKCEENIINLKKTGIIVYLKATPQKIFQNLKYDNKRPILKTHNKFDTICKLLNERDYLYNKYSDIIFDVDENSPFMLVKIIKQNL